MKILSETQKRILESAKILFITIDYANVGISDVAKKAGVDTALVLHYFFCKEFLYDRVFQDVISEFTDKATEVVTPDLSLNETIRKVIDTHFEIFLEDPRILIFILSYMHRYNRGITVKSMLIGMYNLDYYAKLLSVKLKKDITLQLDSADYINILVSLISYPFTLQQLINANYNFDQVSFREFMLQRKKKILDLMLLSIYNENTKPDFTKYVDSVNNILSL